MEQATRPFLPGYDTLPAPRPKLEPAEPARRPLQEVLTFSELELGDAANTKEDEGLKKVDTGATPLETEAFVVVSGPRVTEVVARLPMAAAGAVTSSALRAETPEAPVSFGLALLSLVCALSWLALGALVAGERIGIGLLRPLLSLARRVPLSLDLWIIGPLTLTLLVLLVAAGSWARRLSIRPRDALPRVVLWFALAGLPGLGIVGGFLGLARLSRLWPLAAALLAFTVSWQTMLAVMWLGR